MTDPLAIQFQPMDYYAIRTAPEPRLQRRLAIIDGGGIRTPTRAEFAEADMIRRELAHRVGCAA